jgi:tetratricopeptide (TPR) repeat protein
MKDYVKFIASSFPFFNKAIFLKIFTLQLLTINLNLYPKESIPVLLSSNSSSYITTLNTVQNKLEEPLEVTFLSSLNGVEESEYFKKLESKNTKFLVTVGNLATSKAIEKLSNTKIIFSYVNAPSSKNYSSISNVCGVHTDISIREYFKTLKEISPQTKKVISFYSNKIGEFYASEGEYYEIEFEFDYKKILVSTRSDIEKYLQKNQSEIDAIYVVNDPIYTPENFQLISNYSKLNNKIIFTQIPFITQLGATFSLTPYFSRVGTLISELIQNVQGNKIECQNAKGPLIKEFYLNVNSEYARLSNIEIPENILIRFQNSKLIVEGINSYEEGNIELSEILFDKVLKNDPNDIVANTYKAEIDFRKKGVNLDKLKNEAEREFKLGNLSSAREMYKKLSTFLPNDKTVKEKLNSIIELDSEKERLSGEKLEKQGEVLAAINKFTSAITINPFNQKAKLNLESIRSKERKNIPSYSLIAIRLYNQREYDASEDGFKKILAIDPNDKNANEYLKLSIEKKLSMKKFEDCLKTNDSRCKLLRKEQK